LRPRKVDNYQKLLQDEVTLKTIRDEAIEARRSSHVEQSPKEQQDEGQLPQTHEDDEHMADVTIERASDDEEEGVVAEGEFLYQPGSKRPLLKRWRIVESAQEGVNDSLGEDDADQEEDDEEEEEYAVRGSKRKTKAKAK